MPSAGTFVAGEGLGAFLRRDRPRPGEERFFRWRVATRRKIFDSREIKMPKAAVALVGFGRSPIPLSGWPRPQPR